MRHSHLRHLASTYKNLATIAAERGEYRRAGTLYCESLARRYDLGDEAGLAELLEGLAVLNTAAGRDADAATLIAAAAALRERTGSMASTADAEAAARTLDTGRQRLGVEGFDISSQCGRLMSLAEIVDFALGGRSPIADG
jgi:hypothetical protein